MISINNQKKNQQDFTSKNTNLNFKKILDNNDMILITKLNGLRTSLNGDNVNVRSVRQQIRDISRFDQERNFDYLSNLLKPEKAKGCKIPSQIPIPSCSFQLHNAITLTTNSSGNIAFIMNPFFLASNTIVGQRLPNVEGNYTYVHKYLTSAWLNNSDTLTGAAADDNWSPVDFGQTIPPVYDQYRLVSASLVVKYIGRLDNVQGLVGGAILYADNSAIGGQVQVASSATGAYDPAGAGTNTVTEGLSQYGNFDLAQDSYYHSENMTLEGVRELYFPIDNSFEEYMKVVDPSSGLDGNTTDAGIELVAANDIFKSGFNWFFYATNAPPSTSCFKLDIYCNFECLPNAKYLNYMPVSLTPFTVPLEEKKKAILMAQDRPIMKSGEELYDGAPNLFNKMIKKFDQGLPGFDKLKSYGLMGAIPGLKSGLALAGNMIQANMMEEDDVE
ncbi:MAG: hypothetical protein J6T10_15145 [Methanobrevibacter sp.]|nr:hypothetical protein [Methanobrevibacter sp.]